MALNALRWLYASLLVFVTAAFGAESLLGVEHPAWAWLDGTPFSPLLFLIAYVLAQQLFISSVAFCLAGGLLFGPVYGTLLNLAGAALGAALSFLISRHLLSGWVAPRLTPSLLRIRDEVEQNGWRAVVLVRLLVLPYAPVNYALGLTRLTLAQFLLPTVIVIAPRVALYTYLGYAGRQALEGTLGMMWHALIALGVLVAITWLPHLLHRRVG